MRMWTKLLAALALGMFLLPFTPTEASAWICYARSPTGSWGWGSSHSLSVARRRALAECAIRTPRGYWCRITSCR